MQIRYRDPPIKVRGSTHHMVETVDHILFIVIFTFISDVSQTFFYHLNHSIYLRLLLTLFILALHLTIHHDYDHPPTIYISNYLSA